MSHGQLRNWKELTRGLKILAQYTQELRVGLDCESETVDTNCCEAVSEGHREILLKNRWWRHNCTDPTCSQVYPGMEKSQAYWYWTPDSAPALPNGDDAEEEDE